MSTLTWLLEKGCFEDSEHRLIESIQKAGQDYEFVEYIPVVKEANFPSIHDDRPYIFHGSINLGKYFRRYEGPITLFCTWENYKCSRYYSIPYIQRILLNDCGIFYPYGGLKQILNEYIKGGEDKVFIRPDGGAKSFSGTIVELGHSAIDKFFYQSELYEQIKPEDLVLIAPYIDNIVAEYRCIVINDKAITCARYGKIDEKEIGEARNPAILAATQKLLDNCIYRPDRAFTVDWAILDKKINNLRIMEFNSFSCAGMYECDTDKIVKAMGDMFRDNREV